MNQVFLITGCSSGIGRALSLALASKGHTVFAGARDIAALQPYRSEQLLPLELDVNDRAQIDRAVADIRQHSGRLDCLINNAGYGAMGPLVEMPLEQVRAQFETNVFAPLALTQQCLPLLLNSQRARVVNIGSAAGFLATPFSGAYCASKSAVHTLSDVLRMELEPLNIHVMSVYPGAVASAFGDNAKGKLRETFSDASLYRSLTSAVEARARISSHSPTTPEAFAQQLTAKLLADRPPAELGIGHGNRKMRWLKKWLPQPIRERLLQRSFQLDQLTRPEAIKP